MALNLNKGSAKLYIYLGVAVAAGLTWHAGEYVNGRLRLLIVKAAPQVDRNSISMDAKSFYPVWVKQASAVAPSQVDGELDTLFQKRADPSLEPPKPPEPDYGEIFKARARVDGVSDDGAFVNGRFYKAGSKLEELALTSTTGMSIVPMIESVANGRILFRVGKDTAVFRFAEGSR